MTPFNAPRRAGGSRNRAPAVNTSRGVPYPDRGYGSADAFRGAALLALLVLEHQDAQRDRRDERDLHARPHLDQLVAAREVRRPDAEAGHVDHDPGEHDRRSEEHTSELQSRE